MTKTKKELKLIEKVVEPAVEEAVEIKPVDLKDKRSENQKIWDAYKAQYPAKAAYKEKLYADGFAPNSILSKLNK